MKITTLAKLSATTGVMAIAMSAAPAFAQDADATEDGDIATIETGQPIVVTGSRIVRPEVEGAAPLVAAIGSEEIETRGFVSIDEALSETPGFGVPVSAAGGQSSQTVGQSFVNLFGIGSQRTLTLVNGRRFVSSNTASNFGGANAGLQVDLNVLPVSLIERIDVLAVKGATTYGSDAIAGTVNLIMKDDFEGVEISGQSGISERGDLANIFGSLTVGGNFNDDRGNVTLNIEYDKRDGILLNDRERTRRGLFYGSPREDDFEFGEQLFENRRIAAVETNGAPTRAARGGGALPRFGGFRDAFGNVVRFSPGGNLVTFDLGNPDGFIVSAEGGDGFDLQSTGQLFSDLERLTAFALGHYDVTDNLTVFVEANYARTEAVELVNQPVYNSALFGPPSQGLGVLLSNPFLNDQARGILLLPGNLSDADGNQVLNFDTDGDGVNDDTRFFIQRASVDLVGPNQDRSNLDLFRIVTGIEGDFELGDRPLNYSVSYSFGRSEAITSATQLNQQNFLNAVDVVTDDDGNAACRITVDPTTTLNTTGTGAPGGTSSASCVPLNLFGFGAPSADAIAYVTELVSNVSTNEQKVFNANLGGDLFDLFGNPVAFNVGYEHRNEEQDFLPDAFLQAGLGRGVAFSPVTGSFNTNEFFGEVLVPLIQPSNDMFIHLFEVDGSVRYIDNSQAGSDTIWSVGARLAPIPSLTLRGSYTQSVRAPAISELFLPEVSVFSFADDPCDQDFIDRGNVPSTRAANCAADGITQPFSSIIDDASQRIRNSGNDTLVSEKSKSWTVGAIFEPDFIPRLTLTADWIDISIDDAIINASLTDILEACYDSADFPNVPECDLFTRDAGGQITDALTTFLNAANFEFAGLQASARYSAPVGPGDLSLIARYFYQDKSEQILNGVLSDFNGEIGDSKHEGAATIGYNLDSGFGFAVSGTWIGAANIDNTFDETSRDITRIDDYIEIDASLQWELDDRFTFRFIVDNVFDVEPPFPVPALGVGGTVTYNSGLLGRRYRAGFNAKF